MKIISLNIRVWTRDRKRSSEHWWVSRYRGIHDYIKAEKPDVICLQEVWWPAKYVLKLGKLGYKKTGWGFSHPVYVRKSTKVTEHKVGIFATMAIVDGVQYFSVHAHWKEKLFNRAMKWIAMQRKGVKCVCAGDFNTSDTQKLFINLFMTSARKSLNAPSADTFANYTRPKESHGEIDHILRTYSVKLWTYKVGPSDLSDHRSITVIYDTL